MQTIRIEKPPIFDRIVAAFPKAADPGVIFAWGHAIYNPSGVMVPPALLAHEAVHGERQLLAAEYETQEESVVDWWDAYISDPEFRYHEELPAHAAEFRVLMPTDRNARAKLAMTTARRLIAPLYGYEPGKRHLTNAIRDLERAVSATR